MTGDESTEDVRLIPVCLRQRLPSQPSPTSPPPGDHDPARIRCKEDYETQKEIGDGSFSVVYWAKERIPPFRDVAIKMCFKKQIIKERRVEYVHREKQIMAKLSHEDTRHPLIAELYATFQDADHLYFVISYAKFGDLRLLMGKQPNERFSEDLARFYSAELVIALEHLSKYKIIHRDVKPENILVKEDGHILLSDFGSAKDLEITESQAQNQAQSRGLPRRSSFVGTAQYVSPEVLMGEEVSFATDIWAFGIVLYQLLTGLHCFHDLSEYLIYRRIQKLLYSFPDYFPSDAKSLVEAVLVIAPQQRLGSAATGGYSSLKAHSFFTGVDFDNLLISDPPFIPA